MSRELFEACVKQAERGNVDLHVLGFEYEDCIAVVDYHMTNPGQLLPDDGLWGEYPVGVKVVAPLSPVPMDKLCKLAYVDEGEQ